MALHYITGDPVKINGAYVKNKAGETLYDTSFDGLAALYNVSAQQIAAANGFKWNAASIYAWLKANGGIETTKGVWSFHSGMVVEIPVPQEKIVSPVPTDKSDIKPAGPATPVAVGPGGTITPTQAAVGMDSMTMILIAGAAIGLLLMMKSGKGKKGRKTSKRRTTRRTTRRRRR